MRRSMFAPLALVVSLAAAPAAAQQIALTFDDAPRAGSAMFSGPERAERLLAALRDAGVDEAAFFVIGENIDDEGRERLAAYAAAGHVLANHSNAHASLNRTDAAAFLDDVRAADAALRDRDGFRPWFRFPYLHEGDTVEKRDAVRAGLEAMGYAQGYVTVDNYDWYLDLLARQAVESGDSVDWEALGALYVEVLVSAAEHFDAVARDTLGRSPAHVLLLHENDLAALYVDDLVAAFEARGWTITTASNAFADPIAATAPDTLFLNEGRVAAFARAAGVPARELVHESEDEDYLAERFESVVARAAANPVSPAE